MKMTRKGAKKITVTVKKICDTPYCKMRNDIVVEFALFDRVRTEKKNQTGCKKKYKLTD
jgi:hypothetical protein